jgi:hypothetical protein
MLRGIHHGKIICPKLLDQRREAKLQWLHNSSQMNGDKDENDNLFADSHNILNSWISYFGHLWNLCRDHCC